MTALPASALDRPTAAAVRAQIDHLQAAILGIEDAIQIRVRLQSAGKRTDTLNPFREHRVAGLRDALKTLEWALGEVGRGPGEHDARVRAEREGRR